MTKYAVVLLLCLSGCGENKTQPGEKGLSAYEIALANGFVGSETDWLDSLVGRTGSSGTNGRDGIDGANGTNGVDGADGADGRDGIDGTNGVDGKDGTDGVDGTNGTDGKDGINGVDGKDGEQGPPGQDARGFMIVQPIGRGSYYIFDKGSLYGLSNSGSDFNPVYVIVKLSQSNGYFTVPYLRNYQEGFFGYSTNEQLVAFYGGKKWITRSEDDQVSVDSLNVEISTNYEYYRCGNGFSPTVVIKNTSEKPLNELVISVDTGNETRRAEIYIPYKVQVAYNDYQTSRSFLVVPDSPVLPGETFSFSYTCGGVSVYAF